MALCRYQTTTPEGGTQQYWGWVHDGHVFPLDERKVAQTLAAPEEHGLSGLAPDNLDTASTTLTLEHLDRMPESHEGLGLVAPLLPTHEVWAAGVTYESSKFARMSESEGGGDFYAKVYVADRPELFLKSTPGRTVGPNAAVRIRADSHWNVPEPELVALVAANGRVIGYTVGNDMSSRDIEGENPLYLPQAKVYRAACALGPIIVPAESVDPGKLDIHLTIARQGKIAFDGKTNTARMRRTPQDIASWLFRENDFPEGVFLFTGTGIVPQDDFTLQEDDEVAIEIEGIGILRNPVAL